MTMRYPGGVTRNELEIRLKSLRQELLRAQERESGATARRILTEIVSTTIDVLTWNDIQGRPSTFPPSAHTHTEADIVDLDKYTQAEVDALLAGAGRVGITYRVIPVGELVNVFDGEQYLVYQELIVDGDMNIDGGELVIL